MKTVKRKNAHLSVETVVETTVSRKKIARIFDTGGALEGTFKQVAGNRKQNYYDQDQGRSPAC